MKKLVLSAIAMIAFSGISNANTIVLEEEKNNTEENTKAVAFDFCFGYALQAASMDPSSISYAAVLPNGTIFVDNTNFYNNVMEYSIFCRESISQGSTPLLPAIIQ
jgi:hypothetical protein